MKFRIIILFIAVISFDSCNSSERNHYYESGELWYTTVDISDSLYHVKEYFKNGVLKAEGNNNINSDPVGHWKEYYSDGILKWEGNYSEQGKVIISETGEWPDFTKYRGFLEIDGSPTALKVDSIYKVRIIMPEVHPLVYVVTDVKNMLLKKNIENPDKYPYVIKPDRKGKYFILLTYIQQDGSVVSGKSTMLFPVDVE